MEKIIFLSLCSFILGAFFSKDLSAGSKKLKIGEKVMAGYSKNKFSSKVLGFYGKLPGTNVKKNL